MTFPQLYESIRYWGPVLGFFGIMIKAYITAKKNIGDWASKLLDNHLSHIEIATANTMKETVRTNDLLMAASEDSKEVSARVLEVKENLEEFHEKQMFVWQGVVNTLTLLEDRTRRSPAKPRKR